MPNMQTFDLGHLFGAYADEIQAGLRATRGILWHPGQKGGAVEARFRQLLRKVLPSRFGVSEGVIYDHLGGRSGQCDIIIFDETNAPLVFNENGTRAIPNETVFAVIEIKTQLRRSDVEHGFQIAAKLRSLSKTAMRDRAITHQFVLTEPPLSYYPTLYYIFSIESEGDDGIAAALRDKVQSGVSWEDLPNMIWTLNKNVYCYYGRKTPASSEDGLISFPTPNAKVYKMDSANSGEFAFAMLFDMLMSAQMYGDLDFLKYFGGKTYTGSIVA